MEAVKRKTLKFVITYKIRHLFSNSHYSFTFRYMVFCHRYVNHSAIRDRSVLFCMQKRFVGTTHSVGVNLFCRLTSIGGFVLEEIFFLQR